MLCYTVIRGWQVVFSPFLTLFQRKGVWRAFPRIGVCSFELRVYRQEGPNGI